MCAECKHSLLEVKANMGVIFLQQTKFVYRKLHLYTFNELFSTLIHTLPLH
jgi:hypothetical protein